MPENQALVRVRLDGKSEDVALSDLLRPESLERIGVTGAITLTEISDSQIRILMSYHFDKPSKVFEGYYIERHENGNMTIRPEAVFG